EKEAGPLELAADAPRAPKTEKKPAPKKDLDARSAEAAPVEAEPEKRPQRKSPSKPPGKPQSKEEEQVSMSQAVGAVVRDVPTVVLPKESFDEKVAALIEAA